MYSFKTNLVEHYSDLNELVRQFFYANSEQDFVVEHKAINEKTIADFVCVNGREFLFENCSVLPSEKLLKKRILLRQAKLSLYKALSAALELSLPWGALTGVRPTKLAYELLCDGIDEVFLSDQLQKSFMISASKAELVQRIILAQKDYIKTDENLVNLYVHIPFCPSRCYYCSFVSVPLEKQKSLIEPYVEALIKEIRYTLDLVEKQGKKVFSVYVGGGTPTSITDSQFERVLNSITKKGVEFTVEAGRPETITSQKLQIMKRHGVTRISVNPQSLDKDVLSFSGRGHTLDDFFDAYSLARGLGFCINTDLIAGLKGESVKSFLLGLEQLINLKPHNITIHTLSQKRGSRLREENASNSELSLVQNEYSLAEDMLNGAYKMLDDAQYIPYYLYRQKLMLANLENAGFTLPSFQCVNNITTMEESLSVYACGAGAISKKVIHEKNSDNTLNTRIERLANIKDIKLYLTQFDERLTKKELFIQN